ncbi:unnamed protein product [Schistocephalus solidus]|uniref:CRIM domain-containing protein n=1 Tax=Schistocephalus solidus TaxID=70667 RepID=A0A183TPC7_SCHSO|nr:unnamed protein product [Schistocephalus solidus]
MSDLEDLLQQVRRNFIASDDSTTCEILCESFDALCAEDSSSNSGSENFASNGPKRRKSPEIPPPRVLDDGQSVPTLSDALPQPPPVPVAKNRKSALTIALENALASGSEFNTNRFVDFAIFDGRSAGDGVEIDPTVGARPQQQRPITIWFWRVTGLPKVSISVQPSSNCTVRGVVGLALWQYFNENPSATRSFNAEYSHIKDAELIVDQISVYMFDTEDDLDSDFPPLKPSDPMHKYEFDSLALVDRDINKSLTEDGSEPLVFVTVHLAQGISLLRFPVSATLQMVMDSAIKRRQLRQHVGYAYRLERWIEPTESHESSGIPLTSREPLDLTLRLSDCQEQDLPLRSELSSCPFAAGMPVTNHFFALYHVYRLGRYDPAVDDSDDVELPSKSAAGAPDIPSLVLQLRKYRASQLRGLSTREVQLIVSPDRLDLQPSRRPKLFRGSKSLSIPMDNVLDCSTPLTSADTADQPLKKVRFSITYLVGQCYHKYGQLILISYKRSQSHLMAVDADYGNVMTSLKPQPVGSVVASAEEVFGLEQTVDLHFEAQWTSARAICQHLNLIFACYASSLRKAYARLRSSLS